MKRYIPILLCLLFVASCSKKATDEVVISKKDKNQAKKFALSVVSSYFEKDFKYYYNFLSDPLYLMEEGEVTKKLSIKEHLMESYGMKGEAEGKKFKDYLKNYEPEIYSFQDMQSEDFPHDYLNGKLAGFNPTNLDFLFVGSTLKADEIKETLPPDPSDSTAKPTVVVRKETVGHPFMKEKDLIFMVRGSDKRWFVVACYL